LQFEALQDRESILAAINFVYGALSTGRLARKHAARLLYTLQFATKNLHAIQH
jgi:hypothetical protein